MRHVTRAPSSPALRRLGASRVAWAGTHRLLATQRAQCVLLVGIVVGCGGLCALTAIQDGMAPAQAALCARNALWGDSSPLEEAPCATLHPWATSLHRLASLRLRSVHLAATRLCRVQSASILRPQVRDADYVLPARTVQTQGTTSGPQHPCPVQQGALAAPGSTIETVRRRAPLGTAVRLALLKMRGSSVRLGGSVLRALARLGK